MTPDNYWPTDGWRESSPVAQGMDAAQLARAYERLTSGHPHMNSLLVVRGGTIVFERYGGDSGPDDLRNVKSVTKSVLSLLIGIALQTGDLAGLDETLGTLLPEHFTATSDRGKREITIRDLLTMRSGIAWSEWGGSTVQMTSSPNWLRFVLDQPLARDPDQAFNYSTGDTQLLAAILHKVTGMTALAFADLYLFTPLGIERRTWPTDPQGITVGGSELALTVRDLAKIGFLVLNQGAWEADQIVPVAWVAESITPQTPAIPPGAEDCPQLDYGYLWWLRAQGPYDSALAVGYGGQYIYVIPALDMVVVMTGDLRNVPERFRDNRMLCQFNLVQDAIVPAAEDNV